MKTKAIRLSGRETVIIDAVTASIDHKPGEVYIDPETVDQLQLAQRRCKDGPTTHFKRRAVQKPDTFYAEVARHLAQSALLDGEA